MSPTIAGLRISPVYIAPQPAPVSTESINAVEAVTAIPSTTVSLGQSPNSNEDARLYTSRGTLGASQVRYALEQDNLDKLSISLISSIQSSSIGARFQGIGAALLEQLAANGGQSVSQSVFTFTEGTQPSAEALKLQGNGLRENPTNAVSLTLTSASGATVTLSLASNEKGLAVSAQVEGGQLTDNELKGLAALADSFQGAINGLTEDPPRLDLGNLVKLDPSLFSSLQMSAQLETASGEPQRFNLSLDDSARTLSLQGPSGNVQLNLDTRDKTLLGNDAQRQAAIQNYLTQFDTAQRRGKGDENLTNLFKAAFVQLNSADDGSKTSTERTSVLGKNDRVLLSGLADFSASISQEVKQVNPMRLSETDYFDYKVSQSTTVRGTAEAARSVQQDQQASLKAAYHASLNPEVALALGTDNASQNYRYHEINDQSSSSTRLAYDKKDRLIEATATQQASQNERVRTFINGAVEADVSTPTSTSESRNLLGLINDAFIQERKSLRDSGVSILEAQLASKRSEWGLQSNTSEIRG